MICKSCGHDKNVDEFKHRNRKCKECRRKRLNEWRSANPEKLKKYRQGWRQRHGKAWYQRNKNAVKARIKRSVERKQRKFLEWKSHQKCSRCPENHPACLEFHHRDPSTKCFNISQGWRLNYSWERLLAELKKCDVLCANCHRKLHYKNPISVSREFKNRPSYRAPRSVVT
jgi:hypothetical protein